MWNKAIKNLSWWKLEDSKTLIWSFGHLLSPHKNHQKNRDQKCVWGSLSYDCMWYLTCILCFFALNICTKLNWGFLVVGFLVMGEQVNPSPPNPRAESHVHLMQVFMVQSVPDVLPIRKPLCNKGGFVTLGRT